MGSSTSVMYWYSRNAVPSVMLPAAYRPMAVLSTPTYPMANSSMLSCHTTLRRRQELMDRVKNSRCTRRKRFRWWPPAPRLRMSSRPVRRSSTNPNRRALLSRSRRVGSTPSFRTRFMTYRVSSVNVVTPRPTRQSSRKNMTSAPVSSSAAPNTRTANCEKKLLRAVTSPSMRSIISPGVRSLCSRMSSDSRWSIRSARRRFVAVQPTRAPTYVAPAVMNCTPTASAMYTPASRASRAGSAPAPSRALSTNCASSCGRVRFRAVPVSSRAASAITCHFRGPRYVASTPSAVEGLPGKGASGGWEEEVEAGAVILTG